MMNVFSKLRRYIFSFFDHNNNIDDEPTVTYTIGNKRINNENLNDNFFNKRRKLSPNQTEGIIEVDFLRQPARKGSFNIMPQQRRSDFMNSLKGNKKNNIRVNPEVIEINDNDDVDQAGSSRVIELDLTEEPTSETDTRKSSKHTTVPLSSTDDVELVAEYSLNHAEGSSGLQNSRAPPHVSRQANVRNQRNKVENRPLKEINNRHSMGYSDMLRKGTSTSSTSSSQSTSNSSKDFSLIKVHKMNDRDMFTKLLQQYTRSPNSPRKSFSETSNISLSDTRLSKPSTSMSTSRRYYTRFPSNSQEKRVILTPSTSKSSQSMSKVLDTSAIDKTVIDLTSEEDDENQRQEIVSNVVSSDIIKNLKTSFVGKDKEIVEEDYIHNILKKYEAKLRLQETHANKIRQRLRDERESFNKTLSEILEKRLSIKEHEEEEIAEQKPSFEIAPITKAMTAAINQIVASKKVPLVQIKDTSIQVKDIRTLENCCWLNDEVINAYMNLIKMRAESKPDKYPKVHCFNTFLYEQLQKRGYNSVRRWTKKIDIFDYSMLIVPIHLGNHWCLIQMKIKEKCIQYFDSMGSPNNSCLKAMLQYLVDEYKDKKNAELDTSGWQLINLPPDEIPQQRNMHDCGVFACTFAEHLTRLSPFNFSQDHMPYFRVKMMYEILTGELLL